MYVNQCSYKSQFKSTPLLNGLLITNHYVNH